MAENLIDDTHLKKTQEMFAKCQEVVSGGESSYARLIGTRPIVMERGEGAYFYDVDGNAYIDWCIGYGPMIFGHRPKPILDSITAAESTSFLFIAAGKKSAEIDYNEMFLGAVGDLTIRSTVLFRPLVGTFEVKGVIKMAR